VTIGGVNGSAPGGPGGGTVGAVGGNGALGVAVDNSSDAAFDISAGGAAYAALRTATVPNLYTINLGTGAVTLIGRLQVDLRSLTILAPPPPPPPPGDADADGVNDAADACPTLAGPAPSGCPPPADVTDPAITVTGPPGRLSPKRFRRGVVARITPNEPVSLELALLGRARTARIARAGDVVLAERNLTLSAASRRVRLKPSRRLVARAKRFTVRLRVIATDAGGNRVRVTRTIRVRPPAR